MKGNIFLQNYENGVKFSGYARILKKRDFGKISFWKTRFRENEVQILIQEGVTVDFQQTKIIKLGSLIFFEGERVETKTGEPSILVSLVRVEREGCDVLRNKLSGINHLGRNSNRVLDMIAVKNLFDYLSLVSDLTGAARNFLRLKNFREFNTGILQEYFEGGQATPFKTQCKANGKTLYLSLTSELKLKRLIVAGFENVYEISQSFRNEGIDRMHLPEFSLLEFYSVDKNYTDMMNLLEEMLLEILFKILGKSILLKGANIINFKPPFSRMTFDEACLDFLGISGADCAIELLEKIFPEIFNDRMDEFTWVMKLVDKIFAPNFINPTFLTDVPSGVSPFAKRRYNDEKLSETSFLIIGGINVATISTDENDVEKVSKFLAEQSFKIGRSINEDYLEILKFGIPETAGVGFGINRFTMLFQEGDVSARETCVFPIF